MVTPERPERATDGFADASADPGVHLVEDQDRRAVARGERHLEREHDARELATRGDLVDGLRGLAGVRRDEEPHVVAAAGIGLALGERDAETAPREREILELRFDRRGQ